MAGTAHSWIFRSSLARVGRLSLGLALSCLIASTLSRSVFPSALTLVANPAPPVAATVSAEGPGEWPRAVFRFWFFLPQFLTYS